LGTPETNGSNSPKISRNKGIPHLKKDTPRKTNECFMKINGWKMNFLLK